MKHFFHWSVLLILVSGALLLSCRREGGTTGDHRQSLRIFLTDHPALGFDSLWLDIRQVEIKNDDRWVVLQAPLGIYNVTDLRNGIDTLLAADSIELFSVRKIRLTLGDQSKLLRNGKLLFMRSDKSEHEVEIETPEDAFDRVNGIYSTWLDVDLAHSVRIDNSGPGSGNAFRLDLKMHCYGLHSSGRIRGEVAPAEALAWIQLTNAGDTITGIPEHDGRYEVRGLQPGIYQLLIRSANGYRDTLIRDLHIDGGQEARVPSITLHR